MGLIAIALLGICVAAPPARNAPAVLEPAPVDYPAVEVHQLSDGTPVWILSQPSALVRIELSLSTGLYALHSPASGRVAANLLSSDTLHRSRAEWEQALLAIGGESSVGISALRTWADIEVLRGHETEGVALLAESLLQPAFSGREIRSVRKSLARSAVASWQFLSFQHEQFVRRQVYVDVRAPDEPLFAQDFENVTVQSVLSAWADMLSGSPSIVVVGATTAAEILPVLEAELASEFGQKTLVQPEKPQVQTQRVLLVEHPSARRFQISVTMPGPGAWEPELRAVELSTWVLGGDFSSRLMTNLRETNGYTYDIHSSVKAWPGHSVVSVNCEVEEENVLAALLEIRAELDEMISLPPSDAELMSASRAARLRDVEGLRTVASLAYSDSLALLYGQQPGWRSVEHHARQDISSSDIYESLNIFESHNRTWVISGPTAGLAEKIRNTGLWTDVAHVSPTQLP